MQLGGSPKSQLDTMVQQALVAVPTAADAPRCDITMGLQHKETRAAHPVAQVPQNWNGGSHQTLLSGALNIFAMISL